MNGLFGRLALAGCLAASQAAAQGIQDFYGPLIKWQQPSGWEVTPIHLGLMPNGQVMLNSEYNYIQHPEMNIANPGFLLEFPFVMETTPVDEPMPASVMVQPMSLPAPLVAAVDSTGKMLRFKGFICGGHSLMADGTMFWASGSEADINLDLYSFGFLDQAITVNGIAESAIYDPATGQWKRTADMVVPGPQTGKPLRWYATVTRLADSRMLVTGGYEKATPTLAHNTSVEIYDPAANTFTAVSDQSTTPPGIQNPDYTHVFQYPEASNNENVIEMVGGSGEALFLRMGAQGNHWVQTGKFRPGAKEQIDQFASLGFTAVPNFGSSSAMLPLRLPETPWGYSNGSIIYAGGDHGTLGESHVDVYDPGLNAWRLPNIPMHGNRHHPAVVILPDGRILILQGHDDEGLIKQVGYAEYVDPKNGFTLTQGTAYMPETRGYHSVAVLLPDGRVMVGSGNVDGNDGIERQDFRYYYPDYMFKDRPVLVSAQPATQIGGYFYITVPHGTKISEVVLMGLGQMTHSFDMNQRSVQLRVFNTGITLKTETQEKQVSVAPATNVLVTDLLLVQAPTTPQMAPPGPYMVFILDGNRVPSKGQMVMLKGS